MSAKLETTHIVTENELVVYRRERSSIWQCRYKVDGVWQRASTKERKLKDAKEVAKALKIRAEIRKHDNLPVITRKFRDVAKLAVQRMEQKLANGDGKVSYKDYIRIINEYLIPILGNRLITNIDSTALDHLDAERIRMMERTPSNSTMLSQNAALNLVFDEAVLRNFLTDLNRPKLEAKTGTREIVGRQPTVKVLERIARRVYGVRNNIIDPFKDVVTPNNDDFVLRTKEKKQDVSSAFQHMFERYLDEHNLLYDPKTEQNRVFYSFRHTYATLALIPSNALIFARSL